MIDPITEYILNEWNLQHDYERAYYKAHETITHKFQYKTRSKCKASKGKIYMVCAKMMDKEEKNQLLKWLKSNGIKFCEKSNEKESCIKYMNRNIKKMILDIKKTDIKIAKQKKENPDEIIQWF